MSELKQSQADVSAELEGEKVSCQQLRAALAEVGEELQAAEEAKKVVRVPSVQ